MADSPRAGVVHFLGEPARRAQARELREAGTAPFCGIERTAPGIPSAVEELGPGREQRVPSLLLSQFLLSPLLSPCPRHVATLLTIPLPITSTGTRVNPLLES